jgi:tellurium resistance protein TerD
MQFGNAKSTPAPVTNVTPQSGGISLGSGISLSDASASDALSLSKGQSIALKKVSANPSAIRVGLGWDCSGQNVDLDCEVFGLSNTGKVLNQGWFIFYGQLRSVDGSVNHTGDNRTGTGDGDDESISINLAAVNPQVQSLTFTVTIDNAIQLGQNFGMVNNAYIRVVDAVTSQELIRYNLTSQYASSTSIIVGEMCRDGSSWRFNAIGEGINGDLYTLCSKYGVNAR